MSLSKHAKRKQVLCFAAQALQEMSGKSLQTHLIDLVHTAAIYLQHCALGGRHECWDNVRLLCFRLNVMLNVGYLTNCHFKASTLISNWKVGQRKSGGTFGHISRWHNTFNNHHYCLITLSVSRFRQNVSKICVIFLNEFKSFLKYQNSIVSNSGIS